MDLNTKLRLIQEGYSIEEINKSLSESDQIIPPDEIKIYKQNIQNKIDRLRNEKFHEFARNGNNEKVSELNDAIQDLEKKLHKFDK